VIIPTIRSGINVTSQTRAPQRTSRPPLIYARHTLLRHVCVRTHGPRDELYPIPSRPDNVVITKFRRRRRTLPVAVTPFLRSRRVPRFDRAPASPYLAGLASKTERAEGDIETKRISHAEYPSRPSVTRLSSRTRRNPNAHSVVRKFRPPPDSVNPITRFIRVELFSEC